MLNIQLIVVTLCHTNIMPLYRKPQFKLGHYLPPPSAYPTGKRFPNQPAIGETAWLAHHTLLTVSYLYLAVNVRPSTDDTPTGNASKVRLPLAFIESK